MTRSKILTLLAIAILITVPAGLAQAQEEESPEPGLISVEVAGTAVISDDNALSDAITYTMTGVTALDAGSVHVGWLVSDDGTSYLNTGAMTVADDGSVAHSFTSAAGENLIAAYDKVIITSEAVANATADSPSGDVIYSHVIPQAAMAHIRHLLTSWPAGADKGILTNLKERLDAALAQAMLAKDAADLDGVRQSIQLMVDALDGTDGALTHAQARNHAGFAADAASDDAVILAAAALVEITGKNAEDRATEARDVAVNNIIDTTPSVRLAKIWIGPGGGTIISILEEARNGFDTDGDGTIEAIVGEGAAEQVYVEAQKMATYTLTLGVVPELEPTATPVPVATATPEPEEEKVQVGPGLGLPGGTSVIGTPSVGDPTVPWLAQLALIASAVFLGAGGIVFVRGRRSRSSV